MGSEVSQKHFSEDDFIAFKRCLTEETNYLLAALANNRFSSHPPVAGCEIEACLVDYKLQPAPVNQQLLQQLDNEMATPELAKFNIELNTTPRVLQGRALAEFEQEILHLSSQTNLKAQELQAQLLFTGILPTLKAEHLDEKNMSAMNRYRALNEQVFNNRQNQAIHFLIQGKQTFEMEHHSVMFEAATTSLQLHLQAPIEQAHHYYNASILASAPIMALSGNSPLLFGKQLWHETRIPLFEQSIQLCNSPQRVSFGSGYVTSIGECFSENLSRFPVILPMVQETPIEQFANLSLHNGVVWRWNRPLIGFDPDGTPHIRIEHRVMPAGPTISDMIANAAFYYGLTQYFASYLQNNPNPILFVQAKDNFYQAAKHGIYAEIQWGQTKTSVRSLLLEELLPKAKLGLEQLQISKDIRDHYLAIIQERVEKAQTGAVWQLEHLQRHNGNLQQLTQDYLQLQQSGQPVHTWSH